MKEMLKLFNKSKNMSNNDFLLYLYDNKEKFGLSWKDIADNMNQYEDKDYSEDKYRKQCKKLISNATSDYVYCESDLFKNPPTYTTSTWPPTSQESEDNFDIEEEFSYQKEVQRLKDERTQLKQLYRQSTREDYIKDIAIECAEIIAKDNPLFDFSRPSIQVSKLNHSYEGILEISDWHYGIEIGSRFNTYSPEICKSRVDLLLEKTIELVKDHDIHTLHVLNLGDLISGRIHSQIRIENKEDVITQIIQVSEILAQFLHQLSKYAKIEYYDCLDNHSRIEPNKKESLRLESLARITTWFLRERFKNSENVEIYSNLYADDIILFDMENGWTVAGVHGDLDKLSNVVKNLQTFTHNNIDIICTAHLHHFSCNEENGCTVISNPSLMGMDSYAESKRLFSKPAQTLIVSSDSQPVDSIHRIILD